MAKSPNSVFWDGTLQILKQRMKPIKGSWKVVVDTHVFRSAANGVMTWWPSTGTVLFQGKAGPRDELKWTFLSGATQPEKQDTKPASKSDDFDAVMEKHGLKLENAQLLKALYRGIIAKNYKSTFVNGRTVTTCSPRSFAKKHALSVYEVCLIIEGFEIDGWRIGTAKSNDGHALSF